MANPLQRIFWNCFTIWHARREETIPFDPVERLLEVQNRRVRSIVAHAWATVPFYREAMEKRRLTPGDFRTVEDLVKLPLVSGDDLETAPEKFLSRKYEGKRSLPLYSSGTSGRAKEIRYNPAALFLMMAHGDRQRTVLAHFLGRKFGYREMVASPPHSVSFQLRDFYAASSWVPASLDFKRGVLSLTGPIEENLREINTFRPDLIRGIGSYIGVVFRQAHERRLPIHRPKAILYGASKMADYDKSLIEQEYCIPVISSYQATEALRIGYQCERKEGFHVNVDHTAVRVVDERGEPVAPGTQGDIVVSNLINRATVLLNYKLGDVGRLGRESCPCGRSLPTIDRLVGRSADILCQADGGLIHGTLLVEKLQETPGVIQVQIIQEDQLHSRILVVSSPDADWSMLHERICNHALSLLGGGGVEVRRVDAIPQETGGKIRPIISPYS